MTMPKVGQWAEIGQPGGQSLPFLITHVHDAETVSGVAFSGQPAKAGWHRPTADFAHVTRGESNRQWRETGLVVEGEAGKADIAEAVQEVVSDMLPSQARLEEMMRDAARHAVAEAKEEAADEAPAEDEAPAKIEEAPAADDLTVIPRLGQATAEWLATHDITTFAALAAVEDDDIALLADDEDAPSGVTEARLREWREDAAGRAA